MNERIRELAVQAGLLPKEIGPVVETRHMKNKQQDLVKFAELIVRECVKAIEKTIETDCDTLTEKMCCEFAITDLLDHFGVEE